MLLRPLFRAPMDLTRGPDVGVGVVCFLLHVLLKVQADYSVFTQCRRDPSVTG